MRLKYLLDENISHVLRTEIHRLDPSLVVMVIGDPGCPARGTSDPEIVRWCERHDFVLFTNNRASMPVHLADHITAGGHTPGIFVLKLGWSVSQTAEYLVLVAGPSLVGEYENQIRNLPFQ